MTVHSPHRRWRGHCGMEATYTGKWRGTGLAGRMPWREKRKLGISRRLTRRVVAER